MTTNLTTLEVNRLVYDWFAKLTDHAPLEQMLSMLSSSELAMRFPERTVEDRDSFAQWYDAVTRTYFNQAHEVRLLDLSAHADHVRVQLVVNWRATTWQPPRAYSSSLSSIVHQTWDVVQDPASGKPVIRRYEVNRMEPALGPLTVQVETWRDV